MLVTERGALPGESPPRGSRDDGGVSALVLGPARVRFTARADGDMADPRGTDPVVRSRRHAVVDRPWTSLTQVHGDRVVVVDEPGGSAGATADAAVSAAP